MCHTYGRGKNSHMTVPGWPYSVVVALETGRSSWTTPLDVQRLAPGDDAATVTTHGLDERVRLERRVRARTLHAPGTSRRRAGNLDTLLDPSAGDWHFATCVSAPGHRALHYLNVITDRPVVFSFIRLGNMLLRTTNALP